MRNDWGDTINDVGRKRLLGWGNLSGKVSLKRDHVTEPSRWREYDGPDMGLVLPLFEEWTGGAVRP